MDDRGGFHAVLFLHHAEEVALESLLREEILLGGSDLLGGYHCLLDKVVSEALGLQKDSVPPVVDTPRNHVVLVIAVGFAPEHLVERFAVHQHALQVFGRQGFTRGLLGGVILLVIALSALLFLFLVIRNFDTIVRRLLVVLLLIVIIGVGNVLAVEKLGRVDFVGLVICKGKVFVELLLLGQNLLLPLIAGIELPEDLLDLVFGEVFEEIDYVD